MSLAFRWCSEKESHEDARSIGLGGLKMTNLQQGNERVPPELRLVI